MRDLVRLAIGSWSPLELTATWAFFGIVSGFFCNTPLEVITLYFSWPTLEVCVGYRSGDDAYLGRTGVGCINFFTIQVVRILLFNNLQRLFGPLQLPLIVNHIFWWGHL